MSAAIHGWNAIESFLYTGGEVLFLIGGTLILVWTLILERLLYFSRGHRKTLLRIVTAWNSRTERTSWYARQIRRGLISQARSELNRSLHLIRTLVALCPLLGLLGTVTGMIEVFEVMALLGNENPRAMAAGIYRATLPTMAGMVAALSGLFFMRALQNHAQRTARTMADQLGEG